jgi:DNA adenine methylase
MRYREKILNEHRSKCYPFLKWAGGKTQLLPKISKLVPQFYSRYFEPFLGGGAIFFYMVSNNHMGSEAHLIDINRELINTYEVIKSSVEELIVSLFKYQEEYNKSPVKFYYDLRDKFDLNATSVEKAARTITLNKTCYNGLYRVNRNGEFNVPIGRYKKPVICDSKNLRNINNALLNSKTHLYLSDYRTVLVDKPKEDDFIYLDPPYDPVSTTAKFTGYTECGFTDKDQRDLSRIFMKLNERGCKVLLSNSDTPYIRELYNDFSRYMHQINALRSISTTKKALLITFWVKGQHTLPFKGDEALKWKVEFLSFLLRFDVVKASGFDFSSIIFGYMLIVLSLSASTIRSPLINV